MSSWQTMLSLGILLGATAPLAMAGESSAGTVSVEFVNPEKFTDARYGASRPRDAEDNPVLQELRQHVETRAARYLNRGQTLSLRFLDVDLAGDREPTTDPGLFDVRIVRDVYPPRLHFSYELSDELGAVIKAGEVDIRDLGFRSASTLSPGQMLRYERRMLSKWLHKELGNSPVR